MMIATMLHNYLECLLSANFDCMNTYTKFLVVADQSMKNELSGWNQIR